MDYMLNEVTSMGSGIEEPEDRGVTEIEHEDWFIQMLEEAKAIIIEKEFESRWAIVEAYWLLGELITNVQQAEGGSRKEIYGKKIVEEVSYNLSRDKVEIYKAVQFYKKFPDKDLLPVGKNISWNKIKKEYLPEPKVEPEQILEDSGGPSTMCYCETCGQKLPKGYIPKEIPEIPETSILPGFPEVIAISAISEISETQPISVDFQPFYDHRLVVLWKDITDTTLRNKLLRNIKSATELEKKVGYEHLITLLQGIRMIRADKYAGTALHTIGNYIELEKKLEKVEAYIQGKIDQESTPASNVAIFN